MEIISNRELLAKADMALSELTSNGGVLQPAQAENFMRVMIAEGRVLREANVIPMKAPVQEVDKVTFGSRILRNGVASQALSLADRSSPTTSKTTLTAQLFKAEVQLNSETLEDNIEQGRFKDTVMQLMAEAVARDMDEVIIQGDTASADLFLKSFAGMIAGATSNVVSAGTVNLSQGILKQTIKAMPNQFLRAKDRLRFFTSLDAENDYKDALAQRGTPAGDQYVLDGKAASYAGVPVIGCAMFPENPTNVILTDPANILVGIWRQIMLESDKDISAGVVKLVATLRFVFKYAEETAAVKVTNVRTTG